MRQKNVALLDSLDRKYRGGVTSRKALKGSDSEDDQSGDDTLDDDNDVSSFDDSEDEAIAEIKKKGSER